MTKILVILYRTLGDCLLGTTLVANIKKKYPDSEITMACYPEYAEVYSNNPGIKGLILTQNHDLVLKEATSGKYNKVMCPAQLTQEDTWWHHNEKYKYQHLVDFYGQRCGGLKITDRHTDLFPSEEDKKKAEEIIKDNNFIAIHTTTGVPTKDWDIKKFQELVDINDKDLKNIIQVGGSQDKKLQGVQDYCAKLSITQLAAVLEKCKCYIGLDSGVSYIADSMNAPVICLLGSTYAEPKTSGPISDKVHWIIADSPCKQRCHSNCVYNKPCINNITVEKVYNKIKEILK